MRGLRVGYASALGGRGGVDAMYRPPTGITVTAEDKADMRAFLSFLRHSPA